jgi:hypothetical protein
MEGRILGQELVYKVYNLNIKNDDDDDDNNNNNR